MRNNDKAISAVIGILLLNCVGTFVWANVWRPEGLSYDAANLAFYICLGATGNAFVVWLRERT